MTLCLLLPALSPSRPLSSLALLSAVLSRRQILSWKQEMDHSLRGMPFSARPNADLSLGSSDDLVKQTCIEARYFYLLNLVQQNSH